LGEALAAPHKANKINQIGAKKAGKSQIGGKNKGESPVLFAFFYLGSQNLCALFARPLPRNDSKFSGGSENVRRGIGDWGSGAGPAVFGLCLYFFFRGVATCVNNSFSNGNNIE